MSHRHSPNRPPRPNDRPIVVAAEGSRDDQVRSFSLERVPVRGRIVRLGPVLDEILAPHGYPEAIAGQLARLSALSALLGSMLKTRGRLTVQARGQANAPLSFMVADYQAPDGPGDAAGLRAYAAFDEVAATRLDEDADLVAWCGSRGDLAFTLESGPKAERWQGIVPLVDGDLARAAEHYFEQSEQIPTRLVLAAGRRGTALSGWRAGGLLIQHMPTGGGEEREADTDGWPRVQTLFETLRAGELLDPALDHDALLLRLFHEEGVRVFGPVPLAHRCSCSRDKVRAVVAEFTPAERERLVGEDGAISVRCQFCGRAYQLDPSDFATAEQSE